jgi:hypothetical protein
MIDAAMAAVRPDFVMPPDGIAALLATLEGGAA